MANYDYLFKYIVVGDSGCGKSSLLMQFTDHRFDITNPMTIGVDFAAKTMQLDVEIDKSIESKTVKIQVWDTSGQESFRSICRSYFRGAAVAFLVYDITRKETFENAIKWFQDLKQYSNTDCTIFLIGNKTDLAHRREVSVEQGQQLANKHDMIFYETSAKNYDVVCNAFISSAKVVLENILVHHKYNLETDSSGIRVGSKSYHLQLKKANQKVNESGYGYCGC